MTEAAEPIRDKNGHVRKANVCTSCMKAGKVERA